MDDFEAVDFPPRLPHSVDFDRSSVVHKVCGRVERKPVCLTKYQNYLDAEGRIADEYGFRKEIFKCGVCSEARSVIWPLLFGIFPFNFTKREKEVMYADHTAKYCAMKNKSKLLLEQIEGEPGEKINHPGYLKEVPESDVIEPSSPDPDLQQQIISLQIQAQVFAERYSAFDIKEFLSAIRVIDKDVPRTDRSIEYFRGPTNVHLRMLRNVLVTYAAFHPSVGYAQGMNDIVSRFLVVMDDEVLAFWCLVNYMEHMKADFVEDGMLTKLHLVRKLLGELDTDLLAYLDHLSVADMTFCHRWMLLSFKREFNEEDSLRCFEVLSCRHLDLGSPEAEYTTHREQSKGFLQRGGSNWVEESPQTTEFTFEVFMCATILMHYRKQFFNCNETSDIFAFISSLTMNMDLNVLLEKSESLFYSYCKKTAITDCFEVVEPPSPIDVLINRKLAVKSSKNSKANSNKR